MGYYTFYEIEDVSGQNAERLKLDFSNGEILTEYGALNQIFEHIPGYAHDTMKWYGYNEDMRRISSEYPNTLIVLSGKGEEAGDMWRAYFRNGEYELAQAQIVYPAPSEAILGNDVEVLDEAKEDLPDEDY